jgi:hypothetical protein
MSKIKIILDKDESLEEAELDIIKAFSHQRSGDVHENESFQDPAMIDIFDQMKILHQDIYDQLIKDVCKALDEDYTNGNV